MLTQKLCYNLKYKKERRSCVLENVKLAGTAQVLRLTKPWHGSGRAISADSAFASVTTALACRKHGLLFTGLVKTATKFYPKGYMDEVEFAELGDDIPLTTTVDGHNIMAHAWGDKVRKCFVSTHSTTIPGRPSNKRRWREVLDEDGEEIGQSEVFNKTVKRKKVVETYFDAASIIDNNHMRQGGVALETAWQTQSWASRFISTILGIVETDAYLLYKKFHPGGSKISHSDFTESVAKGLLIRRIHELYHLLCWHNEDAVSVVANSAVTKLSEGGVGCWVKWGKKLYYGDVVASGIELSDATCPKEASTPKRKKMAVKAKSGKARAKSGKAKSKPIGRYSHRTAWLNKVLFQEGFWTMEVEPMMRSHLMLKPVPATTSQPVPDTTTSQPVPATTSQPVPATTSQPVPATTSQPVPATTSQPVPATTSLHMLALSHQYFAPGTPTVWSIVGDSLYDGMFFLKEIESPDLFERTLLPTMSCVQLLLGTDVPQLFKLLGSEEPEMANIDDVLVVMTRDKAQQQLEERIQQKEKEIASGSKPHDSELVEVKANVDGRNWTKEGCRGSKLWTRTPSIRGGVENPPETERNFS
ncbi:hypothetical protein EMCRGX_G008844 [Ephydatia muelleri]